MHEELAFVVKPTGENDNITYELSQIPNWSESSGSGYEEQKSIGAFSNLSALSDALTKTVQGRVQSRSTHQVSQR